MEECILARADRLELEDGRSLRLLSALEVLQARREADGLAQGEGEPCAPTPACWPGRWSGRARLCLRGDRGCCPG